MDDYQPRHAKPANWQDDSTADDETECTDPKCQVWH